MNMKTIKALILALSMLCCMAVLAACGEQPSQPSGENNPASDGSAYRVTVVDAFGEPVTDGVIVRFMQNGQQASMQTVDANGVAHAQGVDADLFGGTLAILMTANQQNRISQSLLDAVGQQ